jgi:hypothetical protein
MDNLRGELIQYVKYRVRSLWTRMKWRMYSNLHQLSYFCTFLENFSTYWNKEKEKKKLSSEICNIDGEPRYLSHSICEKCPEETEKVIFESRKSYLTRKSVNRIIFANCSSNMALFSRPSGCFGLSEICWDIILFGVDKLAQPNSRKRIHHQKHRWRKKDSKEKLRN